MTVALRRQGMSLGPGQISRMVGCCWPYRGSQTSAHNCRASADQLRRVCSCNSSPVNSTSSCHAISKVFRPRLSSSLSSAARVSAVVRSWGMPSRDSFVLQHQGGEGIPLFLIIRNFMHFIRYSFERLQRHRQYLLRRSLSCKVCFQLFNCQAEADCVNDADLFI